MNQLTPLILTLLIYINNDKCKKMKIISKNKDFHPFIKKKTINQLIL